METATATRRTLRQLNQGERELIAPDVRELTALRERLGTLEDRLGRWLQLISGHPRPVLEFATGEIYVIEPPPGQAAADVGAPASGGPDALIAAGPTPQEVADSLRAEAQVEAEGQETDPLNHE